MTNDPAVTAAERCVSNIWSNVQGRLDIVDDFAALIRSAYELQEPYICETCHGIVTGDDVESDGASGHAHMIGVVYIGGTGPARKLCGEAVLLQTWVLDHCESGVPEKLNPTPEATESAGVDLRMITGNCAVALFKEVVSSTSRLSSLFNRRTGHKDYNSAKRVMTCAFERIVRNAIYGPSPPDPPCKHRWADYPIFNDDNLRVGWDTRCTKCNEPKPPDLPECPWEGPFEVDVIQRNDEESDFWIVGLYDSRGCEIAAKVFRFHEATKKGNMDSRNTYVGKLNHLCGLLNREWEARK